VPKRVGGEKLPPSNFWAIGKLSKKFFLVENFFDKKILQNLTLKTDPFKKMEAKTKF